ncbi:MAG: CvpA family protein [Candidatus Howiella sp.]|jgi:uncharacterized membrane protein required for colicin V production
MGTGLVLDIVLLLIVIAFIWSSARRGFVRTAIELAGWLLMLYIAMSFSQPIADGVYDRFLSQPVVEKTSEVVNASLSPSGGSVEEVWEQLPTFLTAGAELMGISKGQVISSMTSAVEEGASAVSDQVVRSVVAPLCKGILHWIVVAAVFTVGMILVRFAAVWLNRLLSFHILGALNRALGGVLGLFKGLLAVFLICIVLSLLFCVSPSGFGFVKEEMLHTSYVYGFFSQFGLFS